MSKISLGSAILKMRALTTSAQVDVVRDLALPDILDRLLYLEGEIKSLQQFTSETEQGEPAGDA